MSEATVTAQIAEYLQANGSTATGGNDTIPFLNVVNQYPPKFEPEGTIMANDLPADSPITAGINSGAIIYLYMKDNDEAQIEFRGTEDPGGKMVYYNYDLICVMFSEHSKSEDTGIDNTNFVDGLRQAIRNSKNAGGYGAVLSWGQGNQTGSKDISVKKDLPQQFHGTFGKTYVYTVVSLMVLEDLTTGPTMSFPNTVVRKFPFAHNTPDILTGASLYTPVVGDIIYDIWVEIDTPWNGTTPMGDFGTFVGSSGRGIINALSSSPLDMTVADVNPFNEYFGDGLLGSPNIHSSLAIATIYDTDIRWPLKVVADNPIKVCVSQDGTNTGANPDSTQGSGYLYIVTATPS